MSAMLVMSVIRVTAADDGSISQTDLDFTAEERSEIVGPATYIRTEPITDDAVYWRALSMPGGLDSVIVNADGEVQFVSLKLYQDAIPLRPLPLRNTPVTTSVQPRPGSVANIFSGRRGNTFLQLASRQVPDRKVAADQILGIEAKARTTSDVGSLIGKSSRNRGVVAQKRNPIVTDPRIRGSRVGQLAASGSHWIPARIDLDTVLSKVDSSLISSVNVVKGPYAVEYGPGVSFLNFDLTDSPRSDDGPDAGGSTSLEYQANGERWYGRQTLSYADENWGARIGYGHKTGSDYDSGGGANIPSSYKSRDLDVAFGFDVEPGQSVEVFYLHQDQTDVELPGQAFDLDALTTDAIETTWSNSNIEWADGIELEGWYNQSRLKGSAQRSGKRRTFPFLDTILYVGVTNVDSLSTGARAKATWELDEDLIFAAGVDARVVRQELEEISSGQFGLSNFNNANSPVPRSVAANPGLFLELTDTSFDDLTLTTGVRTDIVTTEMIADAGAVQNLGTGLTPLSLSDILGTGKFDQSFGLWSAFVTAEFEVDSNWTLNGAVGHGQRAPSLTELYAAEPFMFLLQSGLNTITGDPRLDVERRWQLDLGADFESENFRASINGYHAWIHDRITFETLSVRRGPPFNQIEQVNLKYVNTDRSTVYGVESDVEYDLVDGLTAFGGLSYVRGTDESRNGSFATLQADGLAGTPSIRIDGAQRSLFGLGAAGGLPDKEPLPGIPPLESRVGVRANGSWNELAWNIEFAARIVDDQSRVASLLFESETPGFTVFDIRSFIRVNEQISIFAGVENFTDKNYREHFDFRSQSGQSIRQPGLNAYLGTEFVY